METITDIIINVTSPVFKEGQEIPSRYTCDGENINPPILFNNVPESAISLVIIMEDPDAPNGTFDHWLVWNISANINQVTEDFVPGVEGKNSFGEYRYGGPCPPGGPHRYFFNVYALDIPLDLPIETKKKELKKAMEGHVLAEGHLMGRYTKKK